ACGKEGGPVVEVDLIRERLRLLEEYIRDLEDVQNLSWEEFQENKVLRRFVERTLHLAMAACLDIGSHIISAEGYREPVYSRHVIDILAENGWLDESVRENLVGMAGFRNILVHDYAILDPAIVFGVLQTRLADLRAFGRSILARLDSQ